MNEETTLISVKIDWESLAKKSIDSCPKIKKDREKNIIYLRFGLNGPQKTLQAIGDEHKITRERVRQIINNGLTKICTDCIPKNAKKAIKIIENIVKENGGYITTKELSQRLAENDQTQINSLKFIASLSKNILHSPATTDLNEGWRSSRLTLNKIKNIIDHAIKTLEQKNKTLASNKLAETSPEDTQTIEAALSASNALVKTENNEWGLGAWPHVNPRSIKDKSKFVLKKHGKPIHYQKLSEKISKLGDKKVTKQSVHNELIKNEEFILVGRGIYALSDWGYEPGIVEDVIVTVLKEAGEPLHKSIIIERVLERRIVKPGTIILNLQKPKFKKIDKSIYTLN